MAGDLFGSFGPRLSDCLGQHDQYGADKALPAIALAVIAVVGSVGTVRVPLVRLLVRVDPSDHRAAAL